MRKRHRTRVYVAGPYSDPDPHKVEANVSRAIAAGQVLAEAGYAPLVPHLTHYWHLQHPNEYAMWLAIDMPWLLAAHYVVRLVGKSGGADGEVLAARHAGIPVYDGVDEFLAAMARD